MSFDPKPRSTGVKPTCSVVVATRDRPRHLEACLRAVGTQDYSDLDVLVVDSAPTRVNAAAIAARAGCRYVRLDRPGLSRARNRGAREATGEIVVFLDDDVIVEEGCIVALVREFSDPVTMAVTGRLLMFGGDNEARAAYESFGGLDPGPERRVIDRATPHWFEMTNFGALGTGALLAFRRSAFGVWPGFDERLGRGAPHDCSEELYAYFSLVDKGFQVVYTPLAVARHPGPASLRELRRRMLKAAVGASAYMTLLLVEQPRFRMRVLRYAWQALGRKKREWRPRPAEARYAVVPIWRERIAWLLGPLMYVRLRLQVAIRRRQWGGLPASSKAGSGEVPE